MKETVFLITFLFLERNSFSWITLLLFWKKLHFLITYPCFQKEVFFNHASFFLKETCFFNLFFWKKLLFSTTFFWKKFVFLLITLAPFQVGTAHLAHLTHLAYLALLTKWAKWVKWVKWAAPTWVKWSSGRCPLDANKRPRFRPQCTIIPFLIS